MACGHPTGGRVETVTYAISLQGPSVQEEQRQHTHLTAGNDLFDHYYIWGGDEAQVVECWVWLAADASLIPWCGSGCFSQSPLSVLTLSLCSYNSHVRSHTVASVLMLKIPSIWQLYPCLDTQNRAHTKSTLEDGMWQQVAYTICL